MFRLVSGTLLAFAAVLFVVGPSQPADSDAEEIGQLWQLAEEGRFEEVEKRARALLEKIEGEGDESSPEVARVLEVLVEALRSGSKARDPETIDMAERALRIREATLESADSQMRRNLKQVAALRAAIGDFAGALPYFERMLTIDEATLQPDDLTLSQSLKFVGVARYMTGDFVGARQHYERALHVREQASGPEDSGVAELVFNIALIDHQTGHYDRALEGYDRARTIFETSGAAPAILARALTGLANLYKDSGNFAEARPLYERALELQTELGWSETREFCSALSNLGDLLRIQGHYSTAAPLLERAVEIAERILAPRDPSLASFVNALAVAYHEGGNYVGASRMYERSLDILEGSIGANHPEVARVLSNLSDSLRVQGDYAAAQERAERAVSINRSVLEPDAVMLGRSLVQLANVMTSIGDWERASKLLEESLTMFESVLGPENPELRSVMHNLARTIEGHDPMRAKQLWERTAATIEEEFSVDHPELAHALSGLAGLDMRTGRYAEGRARYERALSIRQAALGPGHPLVAQTLMNVGVALTNEGRFDAALQRYLEAGKILEDALGPDHPLVSRAGSEAARLRFHGGDDEAALELALRAERIRRDHVRLVARVLPERQALGYAYKLSRGLFVALSYVEGLDPDSRRVVWDALVRSRNLVLDEMAGRLTAVRRSQEPEVRTLAETYRETANRFANLSVREPGRHTPEQYRLLLDGARADFERAEKALAASSALFASDLTLAQTGSAQVVNNLPEGSAVVSYVRFIQSSFPAEEAEVASPPGPVLDAAYLAFVHTGAGDAPSVASLGPALEIETLVSEWRDSVATGGAHGKPGEALRRAVWDPIAERLKGADRVFIVPDGSLNLVNFAALPVGRDRFLVDTGPLMHYVSAERDLSRERATPDVGRGLLVLGGPDYDATSLFAALRGQPNAAPSATGTTPPNTMNRSSCLSLEHERFGPLPQTLREVSEIAELWKRFPGTSETEVTALTGAAASESTLKRDVAGQRVVHLATHGFFLGGDCETSVYPQFSRGLGGLGVVNDEEHVPSPVESPLVLSGLVLAGANHRDRAAPDEDDGVLTAQELAGLDLSSVEWAVLSACDTGLGQVQIGEGVMGLRRAFHVAGAKSVIMSLWPVDDEMTRRWMVSLYQARLEGRGTAESVRHASRSVLSWMRENDLPPDPRHWAAFVAEGDWR